MNYRKHLEILLQETSTDVEKIAKQRYEKTISKVRENQQIIGDTLSKVAGVGGAIAGGIGGGPVGAFIGGATGYGSSKATFKTLEKTASPEMIINRTIDKNPISSYLKTGLAGALAGAAGGAIYGTGIGAYKSAVDHREFDPKIIGTGALLGATGGAIGSLLGNYINRVQYQKMVDKLKGR